MLKYNLASNSIKDIVTNIIYWHNFYFKDITLTKYIDLTKSIDDNTNALFGLIYKQIVKYGPNIFNFLLIYKFGVGTSIIMSNFVKSPFTFFNFAIFWQNLPFFFNVWNNQIQKKKSCETWSIIFVVSALIYG